MPKGPLAVCLPRWSVAQPRIVRPFGQRCHHSRWFSGSICGEGRRPRQQCTPGSQSNTLGCMVRSWQSWLTQCKYRSNSCSTQRNLLLNNTVLQSDDEELKRITARHRSVNLETRTSSLFVRENHYAIIQSIVAVATIGLGGHTILPLKSAEAGGNTQSIPYTTNPSADYLVTS